MATTVAEIQAKLDLATGQFMAKTQAASAATNRMGNSIGASTKKARAAGMFLARGLAIGGAAAAAFGAVSVKAFTESENALAQLDAVLKSTGGAAGWTRGQAIKLASSLQSVTTFSDEAVLGAQNLLLTFTKIGGKIMPQATETVLNMSQALGQDTKSSAIQLGKALQDPVRGITALRRVGVNFTEQQKNQIATMVENGNLMGAQKMILRELGTEFGGSARKAATTFGGQLKQVWNIINDGMEVIGGFIAGALKPVVQAFLDWVRNSGGVQKIIENIGNAFKGAGGAMKGLGSVIGILKPLFMTLWTTLSTQLGPALKELWIAVKPIAIIIGKVLVVALVIVIAAIIVFVTVMAKIITVIAKVVTWLIGAFGGALRFVWNILKVTWNVVKTVWNAIAAVIRAVVSTVARIIRAYVNTWRAIISAGVRAVLAVWNGIKRLATVVASVFGRVVSAVRSGISRAVGAVRSFIGKFVSVGADIINGIVRGIQRVGGKIFEAIKGAAGKAWNLIKKFLGIGSPSKVYEDLGKFMMQGWARGIDRNASMVASALHSATPRPNISSTAAIGAAGGVQNIFNAKQLSQSDIDMAAQRTNVQMGLRLR